MRAVGRVVFAVGLGVGVLAASLSIARLVPIPRGGFIPRTFVSHTVQWYLSVLVLVVMGRDLRRCGFTRGTFRFSPRLLWWALPTGVLSALSTLGPGMTGDGKGFPDLGVIRSILFVWIYASVAEEAFVRGMIQTLLEPAQGMRLCIGPRCRLSIPVVISGVFFGCSHLVAAPMFGPAIGMIVVITTIYGIAAAVQRERTGSLIPAIIIHMLANVGGSLPVWLIGALRP